MDLAVLETLAASPRAARAAAAAMRPATAFVLAVALAREAVQALSEDPAAPERFGTVTFLADVIGTCLVAPALMAVLRHALLGGSEVAGLVLRRTDAFLTFLALELGWTLLDALQRRALAEPSEDPVRITLGLAAAAGTLALFARVCPLWPAVAVESGARLPDVLAATRGQGWRVLGCVLAVALPFSMLDRMVKAPDRAAALADPLLRTLRIAAAGCLDTASLFLGAAVLAEIYRRLTRRP